MDAIMEFFSSIGIDFNIFWKSALILIAGTFILSVISHFVFGKHSILNNAVSSAIGILFIYAVSVVLQSLGTDFSNYIAPLPFVQIINEQMHFFDFLNGHYTDVCSEILSMIILAFLVNLADGWLPRGENIFSWTFFRCLTVVIGYLMHLLAVELFSKYMPEGIVIYAPTILLVLLISLLLTGALKILVGAILSTVSPIIGGLYTFFFATVIGKQITKAILTTAILAGIVIALRYIGVAVISITSTALIAYIPVLVILVILWYIVCKFF